MLRIGWFSTGRGPGSRALLQAACEAIERHELPVQIAYLFSNHERGEHEPADQLLDLAAAHKIPVLTLSSARFRKLAGGAIARSGRPLPAWRADYDQAILHLIEPFGTDIAILAGYMLIAPELCRRMTLLNLHPAAPGGPAGIWQDVIWQLIEQRAESSGVTIFRATPDLDAGPALSFCTYSLHDTALDPLWRMLAGRPIAGLPEREGEKLPLFREIRRRGSIREAPLLVQTLAAIASGQISHEVHGPGFEASSLPLDLSDQVDRSLTADL